MQVSILSLREDWEGMALGLMGVMAFGLTLPITRLIVPYLDPVFIGSGRASLAALCAAILLFHQRAPLPNRRQIRSLLIVALGVVFGFPILSSLAMLSVPASHGGVVLGLLPLMTAVAAVFVTHERPSLGFWITATLGSLLVVTYVLGQGGTTLELGDLALVGAILCAATGYAVGGVLSKEMGGWQVICWALVLGFPVSIVPTVIFAPEAPGLLPFTVWLGFLYLALVSQLFGFFLWNKGLAMAGVARVSQTQLVQPFVTLIASVWLLNEVLTTRTWLFACLVVLVVAIGKTMPVATAAAKPKG